MKSLPFSYGEASWVFKMFLSDCWEDDVSGRVGMVIQMERLDSKIPEHIFSCRSFMKNDKNETSDISHVSAEFNSNQKENRIVEELNWLSIFNHNTGNYTITLVVEILTKKNDVIVSDSKSILTAQRLTNNPSDFRITGYPYKSESGEISLESYECEGIIWKISASPLEMKNVTKILCPQFFYKKASWVLEVCISDRMENNIIQMERLDSEIPEHIFSCRSFMKIHKSETSDNSYVSVKFNSNQSKNRIGEKLKWFSMFCSYRTKYTGTFVVEILTKKNGAIVPDSNSITTESDSDKPCTSASSIIFRENKVFHDFRDFFHRKENCDVILQVQGQEFQAHKAILEARSPVLASTFRNDMKEKATGIVDIEDCDPTSFSDFLCFLYCGDTDVISKENVFSLYTAADKYDVQDLRETCVEFMKKTLSVDTFCETITLALRHTEAELIKLTTYFFIKNAKEITLTVKWQSFLANNPTESNELIVKFIASK